MNRDLWGLGANDQGHLVFGGHDLVELAESYGTPLHVADEARLRAQYRAFLGAFRSAYPRVRVSYSYKTNCIPAVLKVLHEEGCGAEVVSPYELWLAARLGVGSHRIIYNGVTKSLETLELAVETDVNVINIDSVEESRRVLKAAKRLARKPNVGIRIDPGVGWKAQFGVECAKNAVLEVASALTELDLVNLCCLQVHMGTGLRKTRQYEKSIEVACSVMRDLRQDLGIGIQYLDLGGGFGVPTVKTLSLGEVALYRLFDIPPRPPDAHDCATFGDFASAIGKCLARNCSRCNVPEPVLLLEPGRALTSSAQVLLVTVGDAKRRSNGRQYAIVDGGMQNIAFPLSYEYHACFVASQARALPKQRYHVTGPLCSPEDMLYRNWRLPELHRGDVLAIMDAGAYFTSFANSFSHPRPPVVMVSDSQCRLVRKRESYEYMIALDMV